MVKSFYKSNAFKFESQNLEPALSKDKPTFNFPVPEKIN